MAKKSTPVKSGEKSDNFNFKKPQIEDRGVGSSYAVAVSGMESQVELIKADMKTFLGKPVLYLDAKEHTNDFLTEKKGRKK